MKVIHLIAPGSLAGAERVVLAGTAALADRGVAVEVGAFVESRRPDDGRAFLAALRVPSFPIEVRGRLDLGAMAALRRKAATSRPDVLHVHGYKALFYGAAGSGRLPVVATWHGETAYDPKVRVYEWLARGLYASPAVARVVAVGGPARDDLVARGVPARKVAVVPNPIPELEAGDLPAPETRGPRAPGPARLLFAGRLSPEKGLDVLLHALAARPDLDATLDVAGDGPSRPELETLARRLGLGDRVRFLGWRDGVGDLLREAEVLVLPSRREGLPLVLLEARAAGVVVVASDVGSVRDVVRGGDGARLVPPDVPSALGRALAETAKDLDRQRALAAAAAAGIRLRHAPSAWAEATLGLYRDIVSGGPR